MKALFMPMLAVGLSCVLTRETSAFDSSPTNAGGDDTIVHQNDGLESKNVNDGDSINGDYETNGNTHRSHPNNENASSSKTPSSFTSSSSTNDGSDSSSVNGNTGLEAHGDAA